MSIDESLQFICEYFNRSLTPRLKRYYISKLERYPEVVVKKAFNEHMDTSLRFPKLVDLYPLLRRYDSRKDYIKYDKYSDNRFPVGLMWTAFEILSNKGMDAFIKYCERVGMPEDDRARVVCKVQCAFNLQDLTSGMFNGVK